ncbi:HNH endonuclease signature motif containing protein [Atlantibacter sp.]|uniref:HNH endonuclease n=1 Tax=Atlantibacter sp. TaxID=1903473 RepID=UPI0028B1C7ED|nr:HNH endonuclease signature motif containing protein [Atlantibacter sp.]
MKIKDDFGRAIDSEMSVVLEDGYFGLLLHSWGPNIRNRDYNKALEMIINRLGIFGVKRLEIFLASSGVRKNLKSMEDRRIKNNSDGFFYIDENSAAENRLSINKQQKFFSATGIKQVASGNGTKRILIHVKKLSTQQLWEQVLLKNRPPEIFEHDESMCVKKSIYNLTKPKGNISPVKTIKSVNTFERDKAVVDWVIKCSAGKCERCNCTAPFISIDGYPFLEVHHVIQLAEGGPDIVENCVALCPNCHREIHFGADRENIKKALYAKITRLKH